MAAPTRRIEPRVALPVVLERRACTPRRVGLTRLVDVAARRVAPFVGSLGDTVGRPALHLDERGEPLGGSTRMEPRLRSLGGIDWTGDEVNLSGERR